MISVKQNLSWALIFFAFVLGLFLNSWQAERPVKLCSKDNVDSKAGMRLIPGGIFTMGAAGRYPEESPEIQINLNSFWLSATEVTNAEFAAFVTATGYVTVAEQQPDPNDYPDIPANQLTPGSMVFINPADTKQGGHIIQWWQFIEGANWRNPLGPGSDIKGREHYPVVHIAVDDAEAYARWKGHRLPTEAEFEYAARGGLLHTRYAWGEQLTPNGQHKANTWQGMFPIHNTADDGYVGTAPVGCFEPNAYGLYDMIGNVWEWTSDFYYPKHTTANVNQQGYDPRQPGVPVKVIKGGSYLCAPNYCQRYRPPARYAQDVGLGAAHIGFRTAKST